MDMGRTAMSRWGILFQRAAAQESKRATEKANCQLRGVDKAEMG
jgi:hypothetical protein